MNIDKNWWERQPKWSSSLIPSNDKRAKRNRWPMFFMVLALAAYILYEKRIDLLKHYEAGRYTEMTELIVLVFPAIFLVQIIKRGRQRRRFGETPFRMETFPALLGEKFSGSIEIKEEVQGLSFTAELLLMQWVESEVGDNNNIHNELVYKMPLEVISERAMMGTRLLVSGQVPSDKPASQPYGENHYFWKLYIYSKDKAFKQTWDVPIIAANDYV